MKELSIKNFCERMPHITTLEHLHLYAIYVYASMMGVYRRKGHKKSFIPFSQSDNEAKTRARLVREGFVMCKKMGLNYTEQMSFAIAQFMLMKPKDKEGVLAKIL